MSMTKEVFRISSDLNESMALSAIEDATTDALSEDGRPHITEKSEARTAGAQPLSPDDRPGAPEIDADVRAYLDSEGLDVLDVAPEMSLVELGVQVDKWLGALAGLEQRANELTEIKNRRVSMIADSFDSEIAPLRRRAAYLTGHLLSWANVFPYPQGSKSYPLGCGVIGKKLVGGGLEIVDEAAAMEWAKVNAPEAIKTPPPVLLKDPLKARIKTNGEIPDGCELKPKENRPYVEAKVWK